MNIDLKLLQLRMEKGWSQEYVAHRLDGITQSGYSKIENNLHPPSLRQLELLAALHEVDPSDFLKSESAPTQINQNQSGGINHNQSGGSAANYLSNPVDLLEAAYNETLKAKNETIQVQKDALLSQKESGQVLNELALKLAGALEALKPKG